MDDSTTTPDAPGRRLTRAERLSWGLGSLGTITYLNAVTALVLVYLTVVVHLDPLLAGALVTGARVFDAFTDPLMGFLSDRTHTRWGRRRPYLLLGALVCGLSLPLVYIVPAAAPPSARIVLTAAVLLVYSVGFTVFNVPYLTMPLEMTAAPQERLALMASRAAFMTVGTFVGSSLVPLSVEHFGRTASGFATTGVLLGAFVLCVMLATFAGTAGTPTRAAAAHHWPLREQWRTALENRPFLVLMGVKVLQFIGIAAQSSTLAYFVTAVMKRDLRFMALYGMLVGAATILSLAPWRLLARRMRKRTGFEIGICGYILLTASWLLSGPGEPLALFVLRPILMGGFTAAILLFGQVVWLDAVDYDYRRTGLRREGMFTSVYVFIERLGYSVAPLMLGALLQWFGFDKRLPLEAQSHGAQVAVIVSLVAIPVATFASSLLLLRWYDLSDERLAAVQPLAQGPHGPGSPAQNTA